MRVLKRPGALGEVWGSQHGRAIANTACIPLGEPVGNALVVELVIAGKHTNVLFGLHHLLANHAEDRLLVAAHFLGLLVHPRQLGHHTGVHWRGPAPHQDPVASPSRKVQVAQELVQRLTLLHVGDRKGQGSQVVLNPCSSLFQKATVMLSKITERAVARGGGEGKPARAKYV
eukprot:CAMPEP_0181540398 /NCGR_PEP_ID=MMETSP1110-20121109/76868_1 /TAXON_ID=174948 /ORGANISM="Symbiodinium sp., Strain CCMP421" /LENGTH=172 /DNA_ID=CAMNT_0023672043 /DNA_START=116 /DNA_END=635 /DNA_ORIENTATION=+